MIGERGRRLLWAGVGACLAAMAAAATAAVVAGHFGATFWRTIATIVAVFSCGAAALAGLELVNRAQLRPLGWAELVLAPAGAATLIVAVWKESISTNYANGLLTLVLILLAALAVSTLRLIVDLARPATLVLFASTAVCSVAVVGLGVPLIWIQPRGDAGLKVLLVLVVLVLIGYPLTPVVQRLSHRH